MVSREGQRYFYECTATGKRQWEFPRGTEEEEEDADDAGVDEVDEDQQSNGDAMDICTTPPHETNVVFEPVRVSGGVMEAAPPPLPPLEQKGFKESKPPLPPLPPCSSVEWGAETTHSVVGQQVMVRNSLPFMVGVGVICWNCGFYR